MCTGPPLGSRTLDALGRATGSSRRTLSRLFVRDTGLTFDQWRTRLRLCTALPLLASGQPLARAARAVGYATPVPCSPRSAAPSGPPRTAT
ncbi:helix-turn-helix domain-containing protein [Saccharothrix sp. ST-888]|uniref:helix-turn-helix domain-containing protein n=1 Tax=Saccharothrix sp. ST-888 TaxID=1427391 RepID=UPI0005EC89DA|nr:helix-turn-helix domain-containing protein [Saccharothrix sp. ST-888]KJK56657.1 hypothetical protein UK12_21440 [Saccharothrix sp. ST-888]